MSNVTIIITGVDQLTKKLGKVEGLRILEAPMQRAVYRLQARMAQYPAQRPNSRYRRTGTLGRTWTKDVKRSTNELIGKIGNKTEYAPLVQSARFQARVHRGLWINTDQYVVNTEERNIVQDFENTIQDALR